MDDVFKALADPTRRSLLDELYREDGQTLNALDGHFTMTRFGVMKHLKQLEEAGLVVTKRRGREKLHFLNPIPIRLLHDRWVSKYTEPLTAALVGLKNQLEQPMEKVYEIYIRTTPERLWEAITDSHIRSKFQFGNEVHSDWVTGSRMEMTNPNAPGFVLGDGEILEIDSPRRLVHTLVALWGDDVKAEGASRVTWEIEQVADSCRLVVTHDQMRDGTNSQIYGGWPMILSGLKTWLETGDVLTTPGSLMHNGPLARWDLVAGGFTARVEGVPTDRWDDPAPCEGWVARDVVRHLVEWVPPFLASGSDVTIRVGPSVDDDPVGAWSNLAYSVRETLAEPGAGERRFSHPTAGDHALDSAIGMFITGDVLIHTWDLARATGQDETLPAGVVEEMLIGMEPMDEMLRGSGQYGARVEVATDASTQDRLIAFTGRDPDWSALVS